MRGQVSTAGGRDPLLTLLPALVLLAASLAVARSWPVLTRLGLRTLPRRAVAARLGVSAAAGRPLRPVATAALLTAAIAAATFAGAYRATLERGAADQAAYAVPLDARLTIGATNRRPQDALEPAQLLAAAGGRADAVVPVVRSVASVRITAEQGDPVQLLGLAPSALPRIARWSTVTGAGSEAAPGLLADPDRRADNGFRDGLAGGHDAAHRHRGAGHPRRHRAPAHRRRPGAGRAAAGRGRVGQGPG